MQEQYIKEIITILLKKNPELFRNFNEKFFDARKGISDQYKIIHKSFQKEYPDGNPLKNAVETDALIFSIAYCSYIITKYSDKFNKNMINDFIKKKFIGIENGKFNFKKYNEGLSEFQIFLFLFFGLFCINNNYHSFISLDYEPKGNSNSKFEYSFKFNSFKVNVEVKELDCSPESRDNINLLKMKNGQIFYKKYFPDKFVKTTIPEEITSTGKELKSNFHQIMNNIQRINKKFLPNNNEINLGFIVINYGTSIEEYLSYLFHPNYGYLTNHPLSKTNIDALVIFSLCTETDLFMNNIIKNNHLFVVVNDNSNHYNELKEMRLTNNIIESNDKNLMEIFKEEYGIFQGINISQGINNNRIVTIQRRGFSKEQLNSTIKYVDEMSSIIEMTKKL